MPPSKAAAGETAESTAQIDALTSSQTDGAAVISLRLPGDPYVVRAPRGQRETIVTPYDLAHADADANPVVPSWSDPQVLVQVYRLGPVVDQCQHILGVMFGDAAVVRPAIEPGESGPSLVLWLSVSRTQRHLRHDFMARFAREIIIPGDAPAPALLWEYHDAVQT